MKRTGTAYVLWFCLGWFGAHRFYMGHFGWGVIYAFTLGGFIVLWVLDLFRIPGMVRWANVEKKLERI